MSDFDALLERLVSDPAFQAALAADPDRALAGYNLDADERALLNAQVVSGSGADRTVEIRTSKSGLAGMLGPVAAAFGLGGSVHESFGSAHESVGSATGHEAFGRDTGHEAFGVGSGHEAFGSASGDQNQAFGSASGDQNQAFGAAPVQQQPEGAFGSGRVEATDYHTRVDVDGDGRWDSYTAYERGDGGVDIVVTDHDGRVEFVGHDYNRDGLVDDAEFDTDHDGVLDTRMYDDNGDGWMDRSERIPGT
jgi:hypothetical protein